MFRSKHSLEITVHIVLNISPSDWFKRKESYICEFRCGMLGTHKYNVIKDSSMLFVYVNTVRYITLYNNWREWAVALKQNTSSNIETILYPVFIIIDSRDNICNLGSATCNFHMQAHKLFVIFQFTLYINIITIHFILSLHNIKNDIQSCKLVTLIFFSLQQKRVTSSFFSLLSDNVYTI